MNAITILQNAGNHLQGFIIIIIIIRMDLREIGWRSVEWIQLAQDRTGVGLL
jgi:hypothetical protein